MSIINKEKLMNFAMQKGMVLMQNPKVMNMAMKAFEIRGKVNTKIDDSINKVAKTFKLAVQDDINKTNYNLRGVSQNIKDLTETVEGLQEQLKKMDKKSTSKSSK